MQKGVTVLLIGQVGRDEIGENSDHDDTDKKQQANDGPPVLAEIGPELLEQGNPAGLPGIQCLLVGGLCHFLFRMPDPRIDQPIEQIHY